MSSIGPTRSVDVVDGSLIQARDSAALTKSSGKATESCNDKTETSKQMDSPALANPTTTEAELCRVVLTGGEEQRKSGEQIWSVRIPSTGLYEFSAKKSGVAGGLILELFDKELFYPIPVFSDKVEYLGMLFLHRGRQAFRITVPQGTTVDTFILQQ